MERERWEVGIVGLGRVETMGRACGWVGARAGTWGHGWGLQARWRGTCTHKRRRFQCVCYLVVARLAHLHTAIEGRYAAALRAPRLHGIRHRVVSAPAVGAPERHVVVITLDGIRLLQFYQKPKFGAKISTRTDTHEGYLRYEGRREGGGERNGWRGEGGEGRRVRRKRYVR